MRRLALFAAALILSACDLLAPATTTSPAVPTTGEVPNYDLSDPETLVRLGSAPFEDVEWRRTVGGVTVLGGTSSADPSELELLAAALDEVPEALARVALPRNFLRIRSIQGEEVVGKAVAFTKGPDVYLVDRTFSINGHQATRLDFTRALVHELAHVAQFRSLDDSYIDAAFRGEVERVDPDAGSELVRSFAAATGWVDQSNDPLQAAWLLRNPDTAATDYGRTSAAEDMAESLSMVVVGRADWISADRVRWVEQWLGAGAESLASGKPWAPAGSQEVLFAQPVYEEEELARAALGFDHVEPVYFDLPESAQRHELLAAEIQQHLLRRRMTGVLARTNDGRLPRYTGRFTRGDGVAYWVELWDFREATGFDTAPATPVLTYVMLW